MAYFFPQSVKTHYFRSGPISVDPICLQPNAEVSLVAALAGPVFTVVSAEPAGVRPMHVVQGFQDTGTRNELRGSPEYSALRIHDTRQKDLRFASSYIMIC